MPRYKNRQEAGKLLANFLLKYKSKKNTVILAIPRGGVEIAYFLSKKLLLPMNILVTRKIGAPHNKEFGLGAISENSSFYFDAKSLKLLNLQKKDLKHEIKKEKKELKRREVLYREKPLNIKGKTAILVDDGLATGVTAQAAIKAAKSLKPKNIIFAVPVSSAEAGKNISQKIDEFICPMIEKNLGSIASYYDNFDQITDEKVISILNKTRKPQTML